jgi:hypothetical protein
VTDTALPKDTENRVTRQITLPLRYEADFLDDPTGATKEMFSIKWAVVPFSLNDDWAPITRTKLPGAVQPPKKLGRHGLMGSRIQSGGRRAAVMTLSRRCRSGHAAIRPRSGMPQAVHCASSSSTVVTIAMSRNPPEAISAGKISF